MTTRPPAWLRCNGCYGTGYKEDTSKGDPARGIMGIITNKKCKICKGKGYKEV